MHPYWYDISLTENKVTCKDCDYLRFNMFTGCFYCNKKKCPIPTNEPEELHICKVFDLKKD